MARQRQDRVVLVGRQVQELLSQLAGGVQLCLVHLHRSSYVIGPPVVYLGHETPTLYPPLD